MGFQERRTFSQGSPWSPWRAVFEFGEPVFGSGELSSAKRLGSHRFHTQAPCYLPKPVTLQNLPISHFISH